MTDDPQGQQDAAPQLSTDEARAGASTHTTRYVLVWGLGLVIVGFVAILVYYMLRT